jgi:hypothetical protein
MKNSTQNKARQIVVSSTAPAPVDLKAALEPAAFKAAVEKPHAQDMQALQRKLNQLKAEVELEGMASRIIKLESQRDGIDESTDPRLQRSAAYIREREEQIAAINADIANRRARADQQIAVGPQLLGEYAANFSKLLRGLAALEDLYRQVDRGREELLALLLDTAPNGGPRLVGVPRAASGASILWRAENDAVQELFKRDYLQRNGLDRLLEDAREVGLDV